MKSISSETSPLLPTPAPAVSSSLTDRILKIAAFALIAVATIAAYNHKDSVFSENRPSRWRDYFASGNVPTLQCSQHPADSHMPMGKHYLLDFYNVPRQNLDFLETEQVYDKLSSFISRAGMTILDWSGHRFECGGMTGIFLLSESHVSFHSWPEHDFIAIDVYTCGNGRPDLIVESLEMLLEPGRVDRTLIERGNFRQSEVERVSYSRVGQSASDLPPPPSSAVAAEGNVIPKARVGNFFFETEQKPAISKKAVVQDPKNIKDVVVSLCVNADKPTDDCLFLKNVALKADVRSKFQHIQVADTQTFDRCMFLDNIVQFCESDNGIYTSNIVDKVIEPFVAAATSGSRSSLSVQIIGGGDGWVASYILDNYGSVFTNNTDISIVDIDPMVTEITQLHFDLVGQSNAFKDPRVRWIVNDAKVYLADETLVHSDTKDIVIIDSTDHTIKSSEGLYSTKFYRDVWRILKKNGGKLVQQMNTEDEDYEKFLAEADIMWREAGFGNIFKWKTYIPSFGGNAIFWMADAVTV